MPRVWAHRKLTICYVTPGFFPWSFLQDKNLSKNIFSFLGYIELQKNQYYSCRLFLFLRPSQFRCKELKKPPPHTHTHLPCRPTHAHAQWRTHRGRISSSVAMGVRLDWRGGEEPLFPAATPSSYVTMDDYLAF